MSTEVRGIRDRGVKNYSPFLHREGERYERMVCRLKEGGGVGGVLGEECLRALGSSVGFVLGPQDMSGPAATNPFG